ncbi:uncharacterized protein BCR38DRAFT_405120 [Pseudomassariella vexata]|uniref:Uncharacterized protein n=1 Tax=Pseudomassariella vexata TaxID=1141098 RepID=A0A1Y2EMR1_9PEZI|nr:uncharacterized protein BCR38DRAFT_405120 [Pseudomassariella vexata]ORY72115.1 hypothetical protein BCR38DRAFT_405120 [Pseudomassariella vexata]
MGARLRVRIHWLLVILVDMAVRNPGSDNKYAGDLYSTTQVPSVGFLTTTGAVSSCTSAKSLVYIIDTYSDAVATFENYEMDGGYRAYKLFLDDSTYSSSPQFVGCLTDYYSAYGPLPTWLLGSLGGCTILSDTSMASPRTPSHQGAPYSDYLQYYLEPVKLPSTAPPILLPQLSPGSSEWFYSPSHPLTVPYLTNGPFSGGYIEVTSTSEANEE